ncbi:tetratricopeptide repeat protein [Empedobacter sedimenti]|uniref:tetratricopeptide repeat protein n=1 Tax=Empedobacter sedimenti TaxID=3042610 RepID=UPI0024A78495|nr:tetratricopeptide repeat protein [Empedobacter sedimenti]
MAHRIYIYNIQNETGESYPHYLGEWNYELPALLLPLFGANIRSKGTQLYADKMQGISNLRRFYDLLGTNYQLTYKKAFTEPVNQMFDFLEDLPYDTFQINGTDVFNMNEERHTQQAKDWVIQIKEQALLYEKAIKELSLDPLNELVKMSGYTSFLDILQTDWIHYGLGYWNDDAYKHGYAEVFIENELEGLQDAKGKILAPAIYQEIFDFVADVAVMKKEDQFGYINTKGIEIVPPIYDDANEIFDIFNHTHEDDYTVTQAAFVSKDGKQGLLHVKENKILIPLEYDELEWIGRKHFNAKKEDLYYLVNLDHENIGDLKSEYPFEFDYSNLFFTKIKASSKRKYYNMKGVFIGEFVEDVLEALPNGYYYAKPNKWQKKIVVLNAKAELIESEIDQIITLSNYQSFAFLKNGEWFIYDTAQHKKLIEDISISKVSIDYLPNYFKNLYVLVTANGTGLFDAAHEKWFIEPNPIYSKIEHLDQYFLRVQLKNSMLFWNGETNQLSENYTYISEPIDRENQQLLLYQNDELWTLDQHNEILKITAEEMGYQYNHRHNLRGNDLQAFTKFYSTWKENQGAAYYQYFDDQSLYELSMELIRQDNTAEAIKVLELGAERLHPQMMTELGIIYANEENETYYNINKANELYQKAAKLGDRNAWNNIGYHLQNGYGFDQNTEKAIEAYTKAGELKNGLGWTNLGDLYYFGELVEQDYDTALMYYLKAEKNYSFNHDKITYIYFNKDEYKKVLSLIKKDYDEAYSPIYYAIMYEEGLGGLKINIKKAIAYYEKAMLINHYPHAVKQLLFHYRKDSEFHNQEKFMEWLNHAEENEIEIDRELLGLPKL